MSTDPSGRVPQVMGRNKKTGKPSLEPDYETMFGPGKGEAVVLSGSGGGTLA